MATTVLDRTAPTGGAPRRAPWRSPVGRPAYARPALLVIAVLAAVLYAWGINHSHYHTFYANAVRSMTQSWQAFFYGSFDPGNSITLDKLPGFLWPQALSAQIFGFHPWALTLPQVMEGVASLLVLYRVVRRWAGDNAALIASVAFLLTPVAVGLFRTAVEDPLFTLCVLLAAEATQRAAEAGRLRPLVMAGVWVGVGFQSKMLEAWVVLPALAAVYLLSAPVPLRKRLVRLGISTAVMVAVSASWMVVAALTPAKDRPYVDGTTNNSAFSMVVGYNFLNRFSSLGISAASTGSISATRGGGGHGGGQEADRGGASHGVRAGAGHPSVPSHGGRPGGFGGGGDRGQDGWSKMFGPSLASQTGWLYPLAAVAVVCGLLWRRGRPRTDRIRAGFVLWGTWLTTYFLVFSAGSVGGHTYYMGVIAVPLAALAGGGLSLLWGAYRAGGRRGWVLPGAVAATVAWGAYLAAEFPSFLPWLVPAMGALALIAVVLLVLARPGGTRRGGRVALAGLGASLAAVLLAPGAWAVQVFNPTYGSSGMGTVGPTGTHRSGHGAAMSPGSGHLKDGFGDSSGQLTSEQRKLLAFATAHQGSAEYVFATNGWNGASPYILATGAHVLPLGGFSGQVPFPTAVRFRKLVEAGKVRYVLLGQTHGMAGMFGGGTGRGTTPATRITDWVRHACARVPASAYDGAQPPTTAPARASRAAQTLYRCGPGR
ncbi:glycosyltransferase family 39 protein [Streptomyces yunnanensis]|uniref:Glycosyltransferase family 39 protein n=1 Tax=Streptomyces yunnanensis TaxID=156453 RepID=A0ABY8AM21_9ACTN|nr:glycosyltransferase family 39 protein [Streptomyces yunnanensis]WEB44627.1 glycosyltransferase family 39 protein [Streptomyces yunnanensis]